MSWWLVAFFVWIVAVAVIAPMVGRYLDRTTIPDCFGSRPSPKQQVENNCQYCAWREACFDEPK